jgi:NAD+ synthase (glutamine-hydrolysing)
MSITVAAATLPSVPLDFQGNGARILESIKLARAKGAHVRVGPELEICGYGCLDHFHEEDTALHSWETLAKIISDPICKGMLISLGLPVRHRNVRYNCVALCTYKHIYFLRPKMSLANDGLYREMRHFTPWVKSRQMETYKLEPVAAAVTGQATVPIGDGILSTPDTAIGVETCEELFTPMNPSTFLGLNGAEVFLNSSASHGQIRKLSERLDLIANCTRKLGGIYVYSNMIGVDGDARTMFDGSSMVVSNGKVLAQADQYSLKPVDVITATVQLERVRSYRTTISRNMQATAQPEFPRIECDLRLVRSADEIYLSDVVDITKPMELRFLSPMEEIAMAEAVFLWQYLTRSSSPGYFLALSGGLDSATVSVFVYGMARLVLTSINAGEEQTLKDLRRVTGNELFQPKSAEDIVSAIFHTCYMGTKNSGDVTRSRAKRLSERLNAYHSDISIDEAVSAHQSIIEKTLSLKPKYQSQGGSMAEDLALQNIQARNRLVVSYELAQLSTTARQLPRAGSALLVLGSGNVDENLRGYYTKYDASSADIAPLGSISKTDAKSFLGWARDNWDLPILTEFLEAPPTAELQPLAVNQTDEEDMGFTYAELSELGMLRKEDKLGPWSMYLRLLCDKKGDANFPPRKIAEKVLNFFKFYSMNRHKTTILTPSPHLSTYNPDDNRFDLRPFLLNIWWPYQREKIMAHVDLIEKKSGDAAAAMEQEKSGNKGGDVD